MARLEDELGDIIGKARSGLGVSADFLSDMTQIDASDIQLVEDYQLTPSHAQIRRLAEALQLDPHKLQSIAEEAWQPQSVDLVSNDASVTRIEVPFGEYKENCYILTSKETSEVAVIDPGGAADEILRRLDERGSKLELILVTHAHRDHIGGIGELASANPGVRIVSHPADKMTLAAQTPDQWEPAEDGVSVSLGNLDIVPLYTPGHTPGSVSYRIDGFCFVGDTLFAGSIGRPEAKSIYRQMLSVIRNKVLSLPDETMILPGHGPVTTVREEKAHNPFF